MSRVPTATYVRVPAWSGSEAKLEAAVRAALEPEIRPYCGGTFAGGDYVGCQASLAIAAPGDERIGRLFQGRPGMSRQAVAAIVKFGQVDAFVSTDRACLPPARRLPVHDQYEALLEPLGADPDAGLRILELHRTLRLVPLEVALEAMAALQATDMFQDILRTFSAVPYASRLTEWPAAPAVRIGLVQRLRGERPPPPPPPPPPRQLKFYLDRWLPPGTYRFGDLFIDARELKDREILLDRDGLAFTVEFIEGTTPRHVHWRFRGTLLRTVMVENQVVLAQRYVI